jgi:hypothetical protein
MAEWDMESLLKSINLGISEFSLNDATHHKMPPPAKRSRTVSFDSSGRPSNCVTAMRFLQLLLHSETASQQMATKFVHYLTGFYKVSRLDGT